MTGSVVEPPPAEPDPEEPEAPVDTPEPSPESGQAAAPVEAPVIESAPSASLTQPSPMATPVLPVIPPEMTEPSSLTPPPASTPRPPSRFSRGLPPPPPPQPIYVSGLPAPDGLVVLAIDAPGAPEVFQRGSFLRVTVAADGEVLSVFLSKASKDPMCDLLVMSHIRKTRYTITPPPTDGSTVIMELTAECPERSRQTLQTDNSSLLP
jgi:hypothetical protein